MKSQDFGIGELTDDEENSSFDIPSMNPSAEMRENDGFI
jgi:hypothetical protein